MGGSRAKAMVAAGVAVLLLLAAMMVLGKLAGDLVAGCEGGMKKFSICSAVISVPSSFLKESMSGEGDMSGEGARAGTALADALRSAKESCDACTLPSRPPLAASFRRAAGAVLCL